MTEQIDFKGVERRTRQAYYQDGLLDFMIGVYVLLVGVLYQGGISTGLSVLLLFGILVGARAVRQRFVFPRTGYVRLPEKKNQAKQDVRGIVKVVGGALLGLAAVAVVFFWVWGPEQGREYLYFRFVPLFVGGLFAVALFALARQNSVRRWYLLAGWFLLLGVLMPLLAQTDFEQMLGLQLILSGVLPLGLGMVLFIQFVRSHPLVEGEDA